MGYLKRDPTAYFKPEKFSDYFSLSELAEHIDKDPRWIRRLEADGRIPKARRVSWGKLKVRLWSPAQVEEIAVIVAQHRAGRPSNG
jgi:hypothetical protein